MSLVITNQGEAIFLANALKKAVGEDIDIKLFSNNYIPSPTSTEADVVEVSGGGYSARSLIASNWSISGTNPSQASYNSTITFTFTGVTLNTADIYGYYAVVRSGVNTGKMLWAYRFADAPITIISPGDEIRITSMAISLNNTNE